MKVHEAFSLLNEIAGKTFKSLGLDASDVVNKGRVGQMLEIAIGLPLNAKLMDLEDGELKSTKFIKNKAAESAFVTQLPHMLYEIANNVSYLETKLALKLNQVIHVPVNKDSNDPLDWSISVPKIVSAHSHPQLHQKIESDFKDISRDIKRIMSMASSELHTATGNNGLLQIRTKDSKPYNPILWEGRAISNKNFAFYFTRKYISSIFSEGLS